MICFQFQFFLSLIPTAIALPANYVVLWFAFNFSSFYLWYQLTEENFNALLVVICFQFQFFLSLIPTMCCHTKDLGVLWFAFNFSSFYLWYQQITPYCTMGHCCDLLSISVLSIFDTNNLLYHHHQLKLWFAFNFSSFYLWYQPAY